MSAHALPSTAWPSFTELQRICVYRSLPRNDTPTVRVVSVRSGYVLLLTYDDGSKYILKVSGDAGTEEIESEFAALGALGSRYSHRVTAFTSEEDTAAICLKWVDGTSISTRWFEGPSLDAAQRRIDLRLAAQELSLVHDAGWVHGDLQPTHVRFDNDSALLIDFGVAGSHGSPYGGGLIHYLAPEYASALLSGEPATRTAAGDWYALLASAFVSATRTTPVSYPEGAERADRLSAIARGSIDPSAWDDPYARELAHALLLPSEDRREWVMS
ncbi:hypothetical protein [Microbacterium gorillae]|uniref:hypothetical protein n=1 Tax=Microbacterium gorillae TaxID=1231063 RepID=UPI003D98D4BC